VERRRAHRIIHLVRVAPLGIGPAHLRNRRLEVEDRRCRLAGILPADHRQDLSYVSEVRGLLLGEPRGDIIVAIEAEAALPDEDRVSVRRLVVRGDRDAEERAEEGLAAAAHQGGELLARLRKSDRLKERGNRFGIKPIRARIVHEGRIEGAEFYGIRPRGRINAVRAAFKNVTDAALGGNGKRRVHAVCAAVARYESAVIPGAVAIAEKV